MKKFDNFKKSLAALNEGMKEWDKNNVAVVRAGVIQQFEVTMELSWKTLKEYLEDNGYQELNTPKTVLQKAYSAKIIQDEELWINMLKARNATSHIYNEDLSIATCKDIKSSYIPTFEKLQKALQPLI